MKKKIESSLKNTSQKEAKKQTQSTAQSSIQPLMQSPMGQAYKQALKSLKKNEVPIGAVIVKDGKIISRGKNMRERTQNAIMHAEIVAIERACKKLHSWRLDGCVLYVTLEPCPMCAGAIANARIKEVVFACTERTSGDHLAEKILQSPRLNHTCTLTHDPAMQEECSALLTNFFKSKR